MKPSSPPPRAFYRDQELWLSLVLLGLSAGVYLTATGFDDLPSRFPKLLAVSLAILALALLASTFAREAAASASTLSWHAVRGPGMIALGMTAYLLVLPFGGYFLASLALFLLVAKVLGYRSSLDLVVTAAVAVVALYLSFAVALGVPLPTHWSSGE